MRIRTFGFEWRNFERGALFQCDESDVSNVLLRNEDNRHLQCPLEGSADHLRLLEDGTAGRGRGAPCTRLRGTNLVASPKPSRF